MPSRYTSAAVTRVWNASEARIAALAAASKPSTSAVGSASAYPSAVASSSASPKPAPVASIDGQDEVGGAVDDAGDPGDPVAVQRLAQRAQQRDRAGDRRLVVEVGAALGGRVVQRRAVLGEQRLVGGDHALAGPQRLDQPGAGRLDAADHLDHHVDVVALDQAERVGGEQRRVDRQVAAVAAGPAHGDADELQRGADPGGQVVGLLVQQPDHLGADGAAAEQAPAGPAISQSTHPTSNASRSSSVSRRTITRAGAVAHRDHRRPGHVVVVAGHAPAVGAGAGHGEKISGLHVGGQEFILHDDVPGLTMLSHHAGEHRLGAATPATASVAL